MSFVVLRFIRRKREKDFTTYNQNKPLTIIPTCLQETDKDQNIKFFWGSVDRYFA